MVLVEAKPKRTNQDGEFEELKVKKAGEIKGREKER